MSVVVHFNGEHTRGRTIEELRDSFNEFESVLEFELFLNVDGGPALCMLRSRANAWLMYLRHDGDTGFHSIGQLDLPGEASYRLSNGQIDEYPLAWCLPVEDCFKAVEYFCVSDGLRPDWVNWVED